MSISRQCELVGLNRSTYYYVKRGEKAENILLMKLLDEQYTKTPFYGIRKMTAYFKSLGYRVNRKRVRRLLKIMGLETIYPKPRFKRKKSKEETVFPYLLDNIAVTEPNQVWATDITYIRMKSGWLYLVCVIDWYSRYVLSWEISNTMDSGFAIKALESALRISVPQIFNSDQGSQFTSYDFIQVLKNHGVRISMVGKGRCWDNIFVERLWRTVKYEEVYLKDYADFKEARQNLKEYFHFYNNERVHQSLEYKRPCELYFQNLKETENNENNFLEKELTMSGYKL